jgi:hypothetical protein
MRDARVEARSFKDSMSVTDRYYDSYKKHMQNMRELA